MHSTRRIRALGALLVTLVVGGCAGGIFRQPEVTLEGVEIAGLGLRGGTILVDIQVVNPNRFALNANQLDYQLALSDAQAGADTAWIEFATGTYDQPFSVAGRDTGRVQIPVEFSYEGLGTAGTSLLRRGSFTYRATGTVHARTPLGTHTVPFRKRGTVSLLGTR